MTTPLEALTLILDRVAPLAPRRRPLAEALGLAAAEELRSSEAVPAFTNSAMDGYAVRAEDLAPASPAAPARLEVLGDLAAGRVARLAVGPGQALRIMTGAPMPEGADTVVPVEETRREAGQVLISRPIRKGLHIRHRGEDIAEGACLVWAGDPLRPADLGVLAAVGWAEVPVRPRPRVAVLTTGDELVDASQRPGPGQIRDANLHAVCAQVAAFGGVPVPFPRIPDDPDSLARVLREALETDLVLTTGGISVGDYDFVKPILEGLGASPVFWKVSQKPGGPLGFWMAGGRPVFGLPGNPVAAMLMAEEYVRPALRKMMGFTRLHRPTTEASLDAAWSKKSGDRRTTFLRVVLRRGPDGLLGASLTGPQGSGILSSMSQAGALAVIPGEVQAVPAGGKVLLHLIEQAEDH